MTLREEARTHMELNMCMLGARGVGKTSVMTAIFDDSRSSDGLSKSKIILSAMTDTRNELLSKKVELQEIFDEKKEIADAGISATSAVHTFNFKMGLLGTLPCIDFKVTDYPGEYLIANKDFVNEQLASSSVILIAIDSPYLMENNAEYNEERNQVGMLYEYLKNNVTAISDKLILFVPLKCEKYFYEGQMHLLADRVKDCYSNIIGLFQNSTNIAMAITPILTLGGVQFDHFELNGNSQVAKYAFVKDKAAFVPMFCIQPLYYMMSFIAQQYEEYRKGTRLLGTILQRIYYDYIDKNEELFAEFVKLSKYRIENKFGYTVLSGKKLFYK